MGILLPELLVLCQVLNVLLISQNFLITCLIVRERAFFQQDSITAHSADKCMHCLLSVFGDSTTKRGLWPPQIPHVNTVWFLFLWLHAMMLKLKAWLEVQGIKI